MAEKGYNALKVEVIDRGLCHSCGTCAGICPLAAIEISYGTEQDTDPEPVLTGECDECGICYYACPGEHVPLPAMDELIFGRKRDVPNESLGILRECLGGFARNETFRRNGAGGGATLGILSYAFEHGIIDGAIISMPDRNAPWRVKPKVVCSPDEINKLSDYSYSLVPVNAVLREAVEERGRKKIALVGLPCHIHGWRKSQLLGKPDWLREAVIFAIGVFCPTNFFWEYTKHVLVEKCGIDDFQTIAEVTYHGGATPKHFCVKLIDGKEIEIDTFTHLFWGIGNFVHQRCAVCIDWSGEVADISIGDFWEPWLRPGEPGWSTIITRTAIGEELLHSAQKNGFLYARPTPEEFLVASYSWEIKKHASAHRLAWRARRSSNPVPDYGYPLDQFLTLRPAKSAPWRINARLHGLVNGVPEEEKR